MQRVILLNSDYTFLNIISWKKAMCLLAKGKVEILKATDKIIRNIERTWEINIPRVLRLVNLVRRIYKTRVPFSKKNVIYRDRFICQYCGLKDSKLTIDHVIPKCKGGKSTFDNCVASCKSCNNFKNDKTLSEMKMSLSRRPFQPTIMEFINIKMKILGVDKILKEIWEE